jgi:hypothetical protein
MNEARRDMVVSDKKEFEVTGSFKVIFHSETQGDAILAIVQSLLEHDVDVEDIRAYEVSN